MNTTSERRDHSRYPAQHLKVLIKSTTQEGAYWETGLISTVDFNRFGIGLETECNFDVGDVLSMIIRTDDSTISEVNGVVCNGYKVGDIYRLGVRFQGMGDETEGAAPSVEDEMVVNDDMLILEQQAAAHIH